MKRQIRVPGEKTELICETCESVRSATWNYGDFLLDDGITVKGVMLASCDVCGEQAGLASQSAYLIREAREMKKSRLRTTVTLSRALRDLAESRLHSVGSSSMSAIEAVILAFLAVVRRSPENRERYLEKLREIGNDPLLSKSKLNDKVTIRLSKTAEDMVDEILKAEHLNRSDFVRRAILLEDNDVQENLRSYALV